MDLLNYAQVVETFGKTTYILLGNGFSISCDPAFKYESLYDAAVEAGLSERAQNVFQRLGTNNFEGVLRLLDDSDWMARIYGLIEGEGSAMIDDAEAVKASIVQAIANSHLPHAGYVSEEKKEAAISFLKPYKSIYTTNYDLLVYWVAMSPESGPAFNDGFGNDPDDDDARYVVFSKRLGDLQGIFYLHGALHLYLAAGQLRKQCWVRTGRALIDLIHEGLELKEYPLFVSEGTPEGKLEQIRRNGYLWYALDKFSRIESPLVIFGHSLSFADSHIADAIARNPRLPKVYVGLHGDPDSEGNLAIRATAEAMQQKRDELPTKHDSLEVEFYQSETANIWG